ncbi:IS3 family transposase [Roseovarius sp. A46]|uniref:IS3 family transposase n=1 Tax=Roseovarius sp. A46 TaxID=2109331 RepID=UPI0013E92008|nr:IS3 family transposase [Roseovarius sp. A46]
MSKDHELSQRRQCTLLQLSRSTLYYRPKGESAANLTFMEIIDKQFLETLWYGSRQMARHMKRQGHRCGRHRVRRLMRLMRLVPIYQEPNTSKKHPAHKIYPYLLKGLSITRPNQVWCADITYIRMERGFLYLVAIMDWYSRKVLAWRLSNTLEADFCVSALKEALAKYGPPEIFNTVQGSQYVSIRYTERLAEAGIEPSVGSVGDSYDNALAETIIGLFKAEVIHRLGPWKTADAVEWETLQWVDWFNNRRLLQPIGNIPPAEAEEKFYEQCNEFDKVA